MPQLSEEQINQIKKFVETFPEEEREAKLEEILSQLVEEDKKPQAVQCPFCLMGEGKLKTQKVFEDERFLAVLEINPANPGHILVFPKKHLADLHALENSLVDFLLLIHNLSSSLLKFNAGVNVLVSLGVLAGQKFPHLVVHILPRVEKDAVTLSWKGKPLSEQELNALREKIAAGLVKKEPEKKVDPEKFKSRLIKPENRMP